MTTDSLAEAAASIRTSVPSLLDRICTEAASDKTDKADRLKAIFVLIQCAEKCVWSVTPSQRKNQLPKIAQFLISLRSDKKAKRRERLLAIEYLLGGVIENLWEAPDFFGPAKLLRKKNQSPSSRG